MKRPEMIIETCHDERADCEAPECPLPAYFVVVRDDHLMRLCRMHTVEIMYKPQWWRIQTAWRD